MERKHNQYLHTTKCPSLRRSDLFLAPTCAARGPCRCMASPTLPA